jgi:hypothetical protein
MNNKRRLSIAILAAFIATLVGLNDARKPATAQSTDSQAVDRGR